MNSLFASSQPPQNSSVLPAHGPKSSGSLEEVVSFRIGAVVSYIFRQWRVLTVDIFIIYEIWLDNLFQMSEMSIVCYS